MSETFYREPIDGGDENNYHNYVMMQLRSGGRGALTAELYDKAGALYITAGYIGIDDGVTKGTIEITAEKALSIASITNSHWCQVEVSVSGSSVTFSVTELDATLGMYGIPSTIKSAYDYVKTGYYLSATKRLLGIAYKGTGTLMRIVNCENNKRGFKDIHIIRYPDHDGTWVEMYIAKFIIELGHWNMDTTPDIAIATGGLSRAIGYTVIIMDDVGATRYVFPHYSGGAGAIHLYIDPGAAARVYRVAGSIFDSASFDDATINRGFINIEYET